MTKKQKNNLIRIIITSVFMILLLFIPAAGIVRFVLYLIPYIIIGYDILIKAVKGIINFQPFDECFLMSIATVGAITIAVITDGDYLEAVAVMLFYQIGEWFQSYAVGKSRKNISELMDIRPDYANIEENGELVRVDPDDIEVGSIITVLPGEKIPIDGIVVEGTSVLDTAALTGESIPRNVNKGDEIISGCINKSGMLKIETTKEFEDSTVSKILDLVENASSKKSRSENYISKFASVYTPIVVFSALALAVIPPLINIIFLSEPASWFNWIYRALTFLVISCPCALVISIPLSFFAGIGGASHEGVLIKGSNYLERLSKAGVIVFDKTGTLTKGVFEITEIIPQNTSEYELIKYAAAAEQYSNHPIAQSIKKHVENTDLPIAENIQEVAGLGIMANISGRQVCVGNKKLMKNSGVEVQENETIGTIIHVSVDGKYYGKIIISDTIKEGTRIALNELKKMGIKQTVMLTGDNKKIADHVASEIGISSVYSELLPSDKVTKTEVLLQSKQKEETLVFVGDGVNDAPVLSIADIGISMGAMGSDAAIEASDIVLMDDDPGKIPKAIKISKKCMRIVNQNIWFSIGVKMVCLILGAVGLANMWIAVFADVGVMVIAVLNAIRCLSLKKI